MSVFEHPLVALSLTEYDKTLIDYVGLLTARFGWKDVDFVHVARQAGSHWPQQLRDAAERCFAQPAVDDRALHAIEGPLQDQLLRLASERQRDVILLGHRRAGSHRSVARRMAMVSPASMWLVPEGASPKITGVLAPIDFSRHSADALSVAVDIALASGLDRVHAVHVYFDPSTVRYDEHIEEILGQEQAAFENLVTQVDTKGVVVEPTFLEGGRTVQEILRAAADLECDLIVMSTRGRSRAASVLLGSTTSDTMADTTVPMLAVKHFGGHMSLREAIINHRIWEQPSPKTN
jgi:SulP family sulfate permease